MTRPAHGTGVAPPAAATVGLAVHAADLPESLAGATARLDRPSPLAFDPAVLASLR